MALGVPCALASLPFLPPVSVSCSSSFFIVVLALSTSLPVAPASAALALAPELPSCSTIIFVCCDCAAVRAAPPSASSAVLLPHQCTHISPRQHPAPRLQNTPTPRFTHAKLHIHAEPKTSKICEICDCTFFWPALRVMRNPLTRFARRHPFQLPFALIIMTPPFPIPFSKSSVQWSDQVGAQQLHAKALRRCAPPCWATSCRLTESYYVPHHSNSPCTPLVRFPGQTRGTLPVFLLNIAP